MKLRTQLLLGYAVVFALMIIIAGVMYNSTNSLIASQDLVEDTYQTIASVGRLRTITAEMQNAKRGFLITGDEELRQSFEEARNTYRQEMERLKTAVSSSRSQARRLEEVDSLVKTWIETVANPQIEARRKIANKEASAEEIAATVKEDRSGRVIFRDIHQKLEAFEEAQRSLREKQTKENDLLASRSILTVILGTVLAIIFGAGIMFFASRTALRQVGGEPAAIAGIAEEIGNGNLDVQFESGSGPASGIRAAIEAMLISLKENRSQTQKRDWLKTGIARLNEVMSGDPDLTDLATRVISEAASYLDAQVAAFYLAKHGKDPHLSLIGTYAYTKRKNLSNTFAVGEGLVGQAALEKRQIMIKNVPEDYVKVTSGIGERVPSFISVTPFLYKGAVKGVIEIGTLNEMTDAQLEYLDQAMPALAVAVESSERRTKLAQALDESQQLSAELQAQQEELRVTNEELQEQTTRLEESEEKLRVQQEELQVTNEELEEKKRTTSATEEGG